MDRELVRTCSADQAAVLARAAGRSARVGTSRVLILPPTGRKPIDPSADARYVARVESVDADPAADRLADEAAAKVVSVLFGPYLDEA
jgi:hypothetical protein